MILKTIKTFIPSVLIFLIGAWTGISWYQRHLDKELIGVHDHSNQICRWEYKARPK